MKTIAKVLIAVPLMVALAAIMVASPLAGAIVLLTVAFFVGLGVLCYAHRDDWFADW